MPRVTTKVSAVHLDADHRDAFSRAVQAVLASDLAEMTMAQLVDGLPLAGVAWEARGKLLTWAHPLMKHGQLCEGALEKTRSLRDNFDPDTLSFAPQLFEAYSDAEMGTNEFNMRLIEMVAVSVHQIAGALFNLLPKAHTQEHIKLVTEWQKPSGWVEYYGRRRWKEPLFPPRPTHFFHCDYLDFDLYPDGLADVVGYWAEDRILGGVVVFDRGQSGTECKEIFLHSGRNKSTFRIWRLLEDQLALLVNFLLGKTPPEEFPLPLTVTDEHLYRLDPRDAIALHHVFRDPWERRVPLQKPPERDVRSAGDYPELLTLFAKVEETIREAEVSGEEVVTVLDRSADVSSDAGERTTAPAQIDRLWIFRHGGRVGEPLANRRLPWTGPPEDGGRAKASPHDDSSSNDEQREASFTQDFPTASLFGHALDSTQPDEGQVPKETLAPLMSEGLDQKVDTTGQISETASRTREDAKRTDEQDMAVTASEICGQGAEEIDGEVGDDAIDGSARALSSRLPRRLSVNQREEEGEPSFE